jgi:hypothetical protein
MGSYRWPFAWRGQETREVRTALSDGANEKSDAMTQVVAIALFELKSSG